MHDLVAPPTRVSFGEFTLDRSSGELLRDGVRVAIPDQPLRLLEVLLEHPGVVVSRDHLRERLWSADTFVDFEHGLNAAVKRLRDALGDSAESPRFIETVPRRGYRFLVAPGLLTPQTVGRSGTERIGNRRLWLGGTAVGLIGLAAAVGWWRWPAALPPAPTAYLSLTRLTFDSGLQTDAAFSPDGRHVVYASNSAGNFDLWLLRLDGGAARRLTDHEAHDTQPAWSPDGRTILFRSDRDGGGIFALSPEDRHVTRRTTFGYGPRWAPDGKWFSFGSSAFFSGTSFIASADGAQIVPVAHQDVPGSLNQSMGWHPGGPLVWLRGTGAAVSLVSSQGPGEAPRDAAIADAVRARFAELQLGVVDNQRLVWSSDGRTLFFVAEARNAVDIWRVETSPTDLRLVGGLARVTTSTEAEEALAISSDGALAFSVSPRNFRAWIVELDAKGLPVSGSANAVTADGLSASEPALSPDGTRLAVRIDHPGGSRRPELREIALGGGAERVLRTIDADREDVRYPRWSPDGTQLSYSYRQFSATGFASAVKVLDIRSLRESFVTSLWSDGTVALENPWSWSATGTALLVTSSRYRPPFLGLARVPVSAAPLGEQAARLLVSNAGLGVWQATESPDGRWICYNQTPQSSGEYSELYVVPAGGGEPRKLIPGTSWDDKPRWSTDGRRLYFLSVREGDLNVWAVNFDTRGGTAIGPPFRVTDYRAPAELMSDRIGVAEISVGGNRLALLLRQRSGGIWVVR